MKTNQTGKPILDALLDASESFAEHDEQGETISREGKAKPSPELPLHRELQYPRGSWTLHKLDEPEKWSAGVNGPRVYLQCDELTAKLIVRSVNAMPAAEAMAEALEQFIKIVRTSNIDRSATHEGLTNCDAISSASAALNAWKVSQQ